MASLDMQVGGVRVMCAETAAQLHPSLALEFGVQPGDLLLRYADTFFKVPEYHRNHLAEAIKRPKETTT